MKLSYCENSILLMEANQINKDLKDFIQNHCKTDTNLISIISQDNQNFHQNILSKIFPKQDQSLFLDQNKMQQLNKFYNLRQNGLLFTQLCNSNQILIELQSDQNNDELFCLSLTNLIIFDFDFHDLGHFDTETFIQNLDRIAHNKLKNIVFLFQQEFQPQHQIIIQNFQQQMENIWDKKSQQLKSYIKFDYIFTSDDGLGILKSIIFQNRIADTIFKHQLYHSIQSIYDQIYIHKNHYIQNDKLLVLHNQLNLIIQEVENDKDIQNRTNEIKNQIINKKNNDQIINFKIESPVIILKIKKKLDYLLNFYDIQEKKSSILQKYQSSLQELAEKQIEQMTEKYLNQYKLTRNEDLIEKFIDMIRKSSTNLQSFPDDNLIDEFLQKTKIIKAKYVSIQKDKTIDKIQSQTQQQLNKLLQTHFEELKFSQTISQYNKICLEKEQKIELELTQLKYQILQIIQIQKSFQQSIEIYFKKQFQLHYQQLQKYSKQQYENYKEQIYSKVGIHIKKFKNEELHQKVQTLLNQKQNQIVESINDLHNSKQFKNYLQINHFDYHKCLHSITNIHSNENQQILKTIQNSHLNFKKMQIFQIALILIAVLLIAIIIYKTAIINNSWILAAIIGIAFSQYYKEIFLLLNQQIQKKDIQQEDHNIHHLIN